MSFDYMDRLSTQDCDRIKVLPEGMRQRVRVPFAPIDACEGDLFTALSQKERGAAIDCIDAPKPRLPRFSVIRGEVALLAERVRQGRRQTA